MARRRRFRGNPTLAILGSRTWQARTPTGCSQAIIGSAKLRAAIHGATSAVSRKPHARHPWLADLASANTHRVFASDNRFGQAPRGHPWRDVGGFEETPR